MRAARPSPGLRRSAFAAALLATGSVAQQWRLADSGGVGSMNGAIAYDRVRHQLVCYGGCSERERPVDHGRTMVFDGGRWNVVASAPSGFPPNDGMTFDRARGRIVNYRTQPNGVNGLFEWDGTAWHPLPSGGAIAAPGQPLVFEYDPARNCIVAVDSSGTTEWDGTTWLRRESSPNAPVHSAVFVPMRNRIVGAFATGNGLDLREWTGTTWSLLAANLVPLAPGSSAFASAFDEWRGRLVLYDTNTLSATVREWDGVQLTTVTPNTQPQRRGLARLCFDPGTGRTVLYGGESNYAGDSDTWAWEGVDWSELAVAPQAGLCSAAFDLARARTVAVGSTTTAAGLLRGTWERGPGNWTVRASGSSSPLPGVVAYDWLRQQTVLVSDTRTWLWNGSSWIPATGPLPGLGSPSAFANAMAY